MELPLTELSKMLGNDTRICESCGLIHPLPLWAVGKKGCNVCKGWTTEANAIKAP